MERKRGVQIKEGDRINRWTVIKEVESESGSSNFEYKRFLNSMTIEEKARSVMESLYNDLKAL